MPIRYVATKQPVYGSAEDEFFVGAWGSGSRPDDANNTIYANGGDDWVLADTNVVRPSRSDSQNGSMATAYFLSNLTPQTSSFGVAESPLVGDSRIPHTTMIVETTVGQSEYYAVVVGAHQQIIIDIDFGSATPIGNPCNLTAELMDAAGNVLASSSMSRPEDGGFGSFAAAGSPFSADPYITYPVDVAGTYYINVRPAVGGPGATFTDVNTYVMNVSVTGHVTQSSPAAGLDVIDGGDGDDVLFGVGNMDKMYGGAGNDLIVGGSDTDQIYGGDGDDVIYGGGEGAASDFISGSDLLYGGDGNDVIYAGIGSDRLQGGGGSDVLDGGPGLDDETDYSDKTATVFVALDGARDSIAYVGGVAEDTLRNIEHVTGGAGDDVLIGDDGANRLRGGSGNDVLRGGIGSDVLDGGAGAGDWADYSDKIASVSVVLSGTSNGASDPISTVFVNGVAEDTLFSVESVQGGAGNDVLVGDRYINELLGGGGNDILRGGGGKDVLNGGAGIDWADYSDKSAAVSMTLQWNGTSSATVGGVVEDTLYDIENVQGGLGDDLLVGADQANELRGYYGNDGLQGGGGDDVLQGGAGNDVLDGGDGTGDEADYSDKTATVVVVLSGANASIVTVDGMAEDTIRNVEYVRGGSGSDVLVGDAVANYLRGYSGNDVLKGGGGSDVLDGGEGAADWADYSDKAAAVVVVLKGASDSIAIVDGAAEDTIRNIENLQGGSGGDIIVGDEFGNELRGLASNDVLKGGGGNDVLDGGDGTADWADYSDRAAAVVAVLNGPVDTIVTIGGVAEDTIRNVENLQGGSSIDVFVGDEQANELRGLGGDDVLKGGRGNDLLDGGDGLGDWADYSDMTAPIAIVLDGANDVTAIVSGVAEDTLRGIENLQGGLADDVLVGDNQTNELHGYFGNDVLKGGGGNDVLNGGEGTADWADYSDKIAFVVVTLNGASDASVVVDGIAEDIVRNIENLQGGAGDDVLVGDAQANELRGLAGDDILAGGAGNDVLVGGAGNDHFLFHAALDASTNLDRIVDFNVTEDTIQLYGAIFAGLTGLGTLTASQFVANASGTAQDADDRIIYETDTGKLLYDADGNLAGEAIQFALLSPDLGLTNLDFFVL